MMGSYSAPTSPAARSPTAWDSSSGKHVQGSSSSSGHGSIGGSPLRTAPPAVPAGVTTGTWAAGTVGPEGIMQRSGLPMGFPEALRSHSPLSLNSRMQAHVSRKRIKNQNRRSGIMVLVLMQATLRLAAVPCCLCQAPPAAACWHTPVTVPGITHMTHTVCKVLGDTAAADDDALLSNVWQQCPASLVPGNVADHGLFYRSSQAVLVRDDASCFQSGVKHAGWLWKRFGHGHKTNWKRLWVSNRQLAGQLSGRTALKLSQERQW